MNSLLIPNKNSCLRLMLCNFRCGPSKWYGCQAWPTPLWTLLETEQPPGVPRSPRGPGNQCQQTVGLGALGRPRHCPLASPPPCVRVSESHLPPSCSFLLGPCWHVGSTVSLTASFIQPFPHFSSGKHVSRDLRLHSEDELQVPQKGTGILQPRRRSHF